MTQFAAFALFLCISVTLLLVWPIMRHATLDRKPRLLISLVTFVILVPGGLALYGWLGVPQMAVGN